MAPFMENISPPSVFEAARKTLAPALALVLSACRADPNLVAIIDKNPEEAQVQMDFIAAGTTVNFTNAQLEAADVSTGSLPDSPVHLFVDLDLSGSDTKLHLLKGGLSVSVESWCSTVDDLHVLDSSVSDPRWCPVTDTGDSGA